MVYIIKVYHVLLDHSGIYMYVYWQNRRIFGSILALGEMFLYVSLCSKTNDPMWHHRLKCNIWSLDGDKIIKLVLWVRLRVIHMSLASHAPGVGARSISRTLVNLYKTCKMWWGPGANVSQKHIVSNKIIFN